jgi:hypothetical protein
VPIDEGDQTLADDNGRAEQRFTSTIDHTSAGGAPLLDAILAYVHHELAGHPPPGDLTLQTARVLGPATVSVQARHATHCGQEVVPIALRMGNSMFALSGLARQAGFGVSCSGISRFDFGAPDQNFLRFFRESAHSCAPKL